jgi:hypothetical protein
MRSTNRGILDVRLLEQRSGLFFEYPQLNRKDNTLLFFLPFWENPVIKEQKESRLVEYDLINRGSTLFAHTGAKARQISIDFHLTLPHMMSQVNPVFNSKALIQALNTQVEKDRFTNVNPFQETFPGSYTSVAEANRKRWEDLVLEAYGHELEVPDFWSDGNVELEDGRVVAPRENTGIPQKYLSSWLTDENVVEHTNSPFLKGITSMSEKALRTVETVRYILETIRTCVAGNAQNTVLGPPILRLRHGVSYNDIPLICRDYDISVEEKAGYDMGTLLPHRIKVSLNTSELRTGDFKNFRPGVPVARDTLAGWEALLDGTRGTTDPGPLTTSRVV